MYAALDLHKKYSNAVVMDADGVVVREERFENDPAAMENFSNSLVDEANIEIAFSETEVGSVSSSICAKVALMLHRPLRL
jgi:hypothetical protein